MSSSKSNYPEKPQKRNRPKSTHSGGRKSKTWVSLGDVIKGNMDMSPRLQESWYRSPYMQNAKRIRQGLKPKPFTSKN